MDIQGVNFTNTSPLLLPKEENGRPIQAPEAQKAVMYYCLYGKYQAINV